MANQVFFKPKPPKQGTEPNQYSLGDWLPKMQLYMTVTGLWDVTEADVPLAAMTANQRRLNGLAHICLIDNLSQMTGELVLHHNRAHDVWQHLTQVSTTVYSQEWIIALVLWIVPFPFVAVMH